MSNRMLRIAELVQRELGEYLHSRYQDEAVSITVTAVQVAPDLSSGKILFSIFGDEAHVAKKLAWLKRKGGEFRRELAHRIILKHAPNWSYELDQATPQANRVMAILDEIKADEKANPPAGS